MTSIMGVSKHNQGVTKHVFGTILGEGEGRESKSNAEEGQCGRSLVKKIGLHTTS
jgi:hypothetical protein